MIKILKVLRSDPAVSLDHEQLRNKAKLSRHDLSVWLPQLSEAGAIMPGDDPGTWRARPLFHTNPPTISRGIGA